MVSPIGPPGPRPRGPPPPPGEDSREVRLTATEWCWWWGGHESPLLPWIWGERESQEEWRGKGRTCVRTPSSG